MLDIIVDTLLDCIKLIPFLFAAYLLIEFIEHKSGNKVADLVNRAGRFGPAAGALLGIIPQCGFSAVMANFYAGGVITAGTLLAVFLSTSDEMLPILISENVSGLLILKILTVKVVIAVIVGTLFDMLIKHKKSNHAAEISSMCKSSHCNCGNGIIKSALHHTIEITVFIILITFALNFAVEYIGTERLGKFILNKPIAGEFLAGIIGLIPNCASSVLITELYIQGYITTGAMLAGLSVGSGVGLLVLFRVNKSIKDNIRILTILYCSGVIAGIVFGALPIF